MSDKELKLLATARREATPRRAGRAPDPKPVAPSPTGMRGATTSPLDGRTVVGWDNPAARAIPIDQPTVAGWDHPAARDASEGKDADGKRSRIAALMEAERTAAARKRRLARRRAVTFLSVLLVLVALAGARVLLGR
ncbi:MAG TPA: hypothetical protein VLC47_04385 [Burkholderiales bacterium]|nr:hypothetical protein [Burkholderiales bacterium]